MKKIVLCFLSLISLATPAHAAELIFRYDGFVNYSTAPADQEDILIGDKIEANFWIDLDQLSLANCLQLGGGITCIYDANFRDFNLLIGDQSWSFSSLSGIAGTQDEVFGQNNVVFLYTQSAPGPFYSTLTSIQFQGRFSFDALSSADFNSSIPFEKADWSLFALFGGTTSRAELRGPLSLEIKPESPVPEPASWALMLIGFGIVGGMMRYQKMRQQVAIT